MRRLSLPLILLALVGCSGIVLAQENPFLGKWDITGEGSFGNYVYWLEVRMENGKPAGTFMNRRGGLVKLPEIEIIDGELIFSVGTRPNFPKEIHRARVEEGRLLGRLTAGDQEIPWIGVRPPQWGDQNANGRHRWGTPVQLFNGSTLENWGVQNPELPSGWNIVDGVMTNEARANNLISKHRFENFKIRCEYMIAEKSNSGIFLRGRYELQVVDDHGKEPGNQGNMAIYSRLQPLVNASLPAGQWQVMEATLVANRLTVILNGKKVHDNAIIEGITGGALDSREGEPGPIMIQGDHGKVSFRKITVTPIINLK